MSVAAPIVVSKTSAYTTDFGECVLVDASAGAVTITLPTAYFGLREIRVKKIDSSSNVVTVARAGSATIDGATSVALSAQYEAVELVADGTNWFVIGSKAGSQVVPNGKVVGQIYLPDVNLLTGASTANPALNAAVAFPFFLRAGTLDGIYINHAGSPTASEVARLFAYSDNGFGYPNALLAEATVDLSTAAAVKRATINLAITAGVYWIGCVRQGPTNTATQIVFASNTENGSRLMPAHPSQLYQRYMAWRQTGVSGAMPATWTATPDPVTGSTMSLPYVGVRYSA